MNIDETVIAIIAVMDKKTKTAKERYSLVEPLDAKMLNWTRPIEMQALLENPLFRIGTVGDGNCLLHSILFSGSATYRAQNAISRGKVADAFRELLGDRELELRELADIMYAEIGGSAALEDDFSDLHNRRDEMDILMGPLIAALFGNNLLAIQLRDGGVVQPVLLTKGGFQYDRPTIVINYIGCGVDLGNSAFKDGGCSAGGVRHYESVIAAVFSNIKKVIELDDGETRYLFPPGDSALSAILSLFSLG